MAQPLIHFLLVYDREADVLARSEEFRDAEAATTAYEKAEQEASHTGRQMDIVLVGSDSLDAVKITHSNYFSGNAMKRVREALQI